MHNARSAYRGPATAPNRLHPERAQSAWLGAVRAGSPAATCSKVGARTIGHHLARRGRTWCAWIAQADAHTAPSACSGCSSAMTTRRAHCVARAEAADGKVSTGIVHGPRCTCLTRLRAPAHSEEGGRRRCGAHRHGQRRRSSTAVKVSVLLFGVQLRALAKLLDLRTGREEG
jgi:hypothetical protein